MGQISTDVGVRNRPNEVARQKAASSGPISLIDPAVDAVWAKGARASDRNNYLDYYFSGQDIDVRLSDVSDETSAFRRVPIMELAVQIEQEKMPIYGFWDYSYSAVLRGVRIVSGAMTLATTYPGYMNDLVATAAAARQAVADDRSYPYYKDLTEDDKNIERYWGSNLDPSYNVENKNLFSVHPPFSLTVTYGIQDISVDQTGQPQDVANFMSDYYKSQNNVLMTDENQRLVPSSPSGFNRFTIDAIELKSCQRSFTSDGSICVESYSFMARDIIMPNMIK